MTLYLARMVFRIWKAEKVKRGCFEEEIRILRAPSLENALKQAREIGQSESITFKGSKNEAIRWEFQGILEIHQLGKLKNGMLLTSVSRETEDSESFLTYLHDRETVYAGAS